MPTKKRAAQLDREIRDALSKRGQLASDQQIEEFLETLDVTLRPDDQGLVDDSYSALTGDYKARERLTAIIEDLGRAHAVIQFGASDRKFHHGHATKKTSSVISKVILANRIRTSASLGEPRHYAMLVDQATGRTIYKSAVKKTRDEAAALAETFAKRRHLDIAGRV
jgi:hypothetical protein